jgi:VWFA-related protein
VAGPARAQEPSPTTVFSERIEVNIVEVLVRVTDQNGNLVRGLTRDDFRIFEDGEPVQVTNFMAVEDRQVVQQLVAVPEEEPADGGLLDLNAPTEPEPAEMVPVNEEPEPAEPLFLALYIDNTTLQHRNRKKALAGVQEFFEESLAPGDQVMIATQADDYRILQTFTDDPAELADALGSLKKASSQGDEKEMKFRNLVRDMQGAVITPETATFQSERSEVLIDAWARDKQQEIKRSISGMSYLMSTLAGLPGQRAMLYVGEGLPMRPAEGLVHAHYNKFGAAAEVDPPETRAIDWDMTREWEKFVDHAQTSGIEFWAIDASGKRGGMGGSAEFSMGERDSALLSGTQMVWNQRLDNLQARNVQGSLQLAAGDTGGEVMLNHRNYDRFLDRMREGLDNFYSIGYAAPHAKEGGLHEIRIEMSDPTLKASYQRGYRDKTWNQRLTDAVISQLLLGVGDNPLQVEMAAGDSDGEGGRARFEVTVRVPLERLTLVPQGETYVGSASMVLLARDEVGNTSPPRIVPMTVEVPAEQIHHELGMAEATVEMVVGKGRGAIGVGVRDDFADVVSTTTAEITI